MKPFTKYALNNQITFSNENSGLHKTVTNTNLTVFVAVFVAQPVHALAFILA